MTIEAFKISAGYEPDKLVVVDQTVKIKQGKINVIIGKNGCGKSTLLKTLCRQLEAASGVIKLNEIDIQDLSTKALAKKIGILFQENQCPRELKVRDLVSYGRFAQIGLFSDLSDEDNEKVDNAMELAGVEEFAEKDVMSLSSGQRQLVWIAMLIAQEADFLFLDEPTTYLDLKNQFDILDCLKRLNKETGKTLTLILHDISMAAQYADYLFAMKDGHVIKEGSAVEILTAEFLKELYEVNIEVIEREGSLRCLPLGRSS